MWGWLEQLGRALVEPGDSPIVPFTRDGVLEVLGTLDDPELGVDIVNLGLVRDVHLAADALQVILTLTTPTCPVGPWMRDQAELALRDAFPSVPDIEVSVSVDPPWHPEDMSELARNKLGYRDP